MTFYGNKGGGFHVGSLGIDARVWLKGLLKANGIASEKEKAGPIDLEAVAKRGGTLTRAQVAEFLQVSTKTIQRLEADGKLTRCRSFVGAVRYPARDVLRLASAPGKER